MIDPARKERLLSRARELMTEAGFRIGMSDGGLVTEAKPMIKWDKVTHFNFNIISEDYIHDAGRCCNLHPEERLWSELESWHQDHLCRRRFDWRGCHEDAQGARLQLPGGQLWPGADYGRPQVYFFVFNIFFSYIFPPEYTIYLIDPRWPVFTLNALLFRLPDTSAVQTMLLWLEHFMLNRRNKWNPDNFWKTTFILKKMYMLCLNCHNILI